MIEERSFDVDNGLFSVHLQHLSNEYKTVVSANRILTLENIKLQDQLRALIHHTATQEAQFESSNQRTSVSFDAESPKYTSYNSHMSAEVCSTLPPMSLDNEGLTKQRSMRSQDEQRSQQEPGTLQQSLIVAVDKLAAHGDVGKFAAPLDERDIYRDEKDRYSLKSDQSYAVIHQHPSRVGPSRSFSGGFNARSSDASSCLVVQQSSQDCMDGRMSKRDELDPRLHKSQEDYDEPILEERFWQRPADEVMDPSKVLDTSTLELQLHDGDEVNSVLSVGEQIEFNKNRSLSVRSSFVAGVFPEWFDPGASGLEDAFVMTKTRQLSESFSQRTAKPWLLVTPTSRRRVFWDACAFFFLLCQMWLTPLELVFLDQMDTPQWMIDVDLGFTLFWAADILFNFCTGYIVGDTVIMNRWKIAKGYLSGWFWVDLIATLPFDLILQAVAGDLFQMSRLGRASKFLKTFRYLKMVRALRLANKLREAHHLMAFNSSLQKLRSLAWPAGGCMFLVCFAHVHGCFWALTQPDEITSAQTVMQALDNYYASFTWAYIGLTSASFRPPMQVSNGSAWWLEIIISTERIMLIVLVAQRVIFYSLRFIGDAQKAQLENGVLEYLRRHNVGFRTQIQVLFSLKDNGTAKLQQRNTDELLNIELPPELRRTISAELWSRHLTSLGLIATIQSWDSRFVPELAQLVYEAVFASRCILFRLGESAFATHCILRGELKVLKLAMNPNGDITMPNFTKGQWVGENALVSSILKCSATFITVGISSFMVVRGDLFQGLVSRLGLMEKFQLFCSERLWRGFCGRCGQLGTHFSDNCHKMKKFRRGDGVGVSRRLSKGSKSSTERPTLFSDLATRAGSWARASMASYASFLPTDGTSVGRGSNATDASERTVQVSSDLREFLKEHNLLPLLSIFSSMDIFSLDELENADRITLKEAFADYGVGSAYGYGFGGSEGSDFDTPDLSRLDAALSDEVITEFRIRRARKVHQALFTAVSRLQHLVFLSHYKIEAGTEAALMRTELEQALAEDDGLGHCFDEPVFLDTENLFNLEDLQRRVRNTHNLVLLLTKGVLTRPWVLVEILTARREGVRILLVNVSKPGESAFVFPDDTFFSSIRNGTNLDEDARELLQGQGYALTEVEETLRSVFQTIAVPYSPHKATNIRKAEIATLLKQCRLKKPQPETASNPRLPNRGAGSWTSRSNRESSSWPTFGGTNTGSSWADPNSGSISQKKSTALRKSMSIRKLQESVV